MILTQNIYPQHHFSPAAAPSSPSHYYPAGKAGAAGPPAPSKGKDLNYRVVCGDCRNPVPNLIEDFASGDVICRDCGTVLMDRLIDTRSEWRTFNNENSGGGGDDPSRVGAAIDPLLMDIDGELTLDSTVIGKMDNGTGASRELRNAQNKSILRNGDKALIEAFKNISAMCERIGLPKVISDRSKQFYKRAEEEKISKSGKGGGGGAAMDAIIAACIYIACRVEKVPRTFREMSSLTMVSKKDIGKFYKALLPVLFPQGSEFLLPSVAGDSGSSINGSPLSATLGERQKSPLPSQDPHKRSPVQLAHGGTGSPFATVSVADFMSRFCSHLGLPIEIQKHATALCLRAQELGCIAGKSPTSIAAGCIYMTAQLFPQYKKTQAHIAYVTGVSEVTIKNTYKDMLPFKYQLVSSDTAPKFLVDALPFS